MGKFLKKMHDSLPKSFEGRVYLFFIILTIFLSFLLTAAISLSAGKPIGSDFWFHLSVAESYARGENALFNEEFMRVNKGPYPPLFHLMFVPLVWLGISIQFATFLQIIFFPLAMSASVFFVWKRVGIAPASFTAILLLSSIAFFDRSVQVIPQAFDMIFFPLAACFFLENRRLPFLVSMFILIYSHGAYGFLLLGSLILYYLKWREGTKMVRDILLISAPLIILTLIFLPSYMGYATVINTPQEELMRANPLYFFVYTGFLPVPIFIVSLVYYFFKRKDLDKTDYLVVFWFIVLIPMFFFFIERFTTYAIVPMSIMVSRFLTRFLKSTSHSKVYGLILLIVLFLLALPNYLSWWYFLDGGGAVKFDIN